MGNLFNFHGCCGCLDEDKESEKLDPHENLIIYPDEETDLEAGLHPNLNSTVPNINQKSNTGLEDIDKEKEKNTKKKPDIENPIQISNIDKENIPEVDKTNTKSKPRGRDVEKYIVEENKGKEQESEQIDFQITTSKVDVKKEIKKEEKIKSDIANPEQNPNKDKDKNIGKDSEPLVEDIKESENKEDVLKDEVHTRSKSYSIQITEGSNKEDENEGNEQEQANIKEDSEQQGEEELQENNQLVKPKKKKTKKLKIKTSNKKTLKIKQKVEDEDKEEGVDKEIDTERSVSVEELNEQENNEEEEESEVDLSKISSEDVKQLYLQVKTINKVFEENKNNGTMILDKNYKVIKGEVPIILTAPNAVKRVRNNKTKSAETLTGAIVEYLSTKLKTYGMIRTCNQNDDPNFYGTGPSLEFKQEIQNAIKENNIIFLLDIHGCTNNYGYDINIAIDDGKNLECDIDYIYVIKKILEKKFHVEIDNHFKAHSKQTISKYTHTKSKITCIQFELCRTLRTNPEILYSFCELFEECVNYLREKTQL